MKELPLQDFPCLTSSKLPNLETFSILSSTNLNWAPKHNNNNNNNNNNNK